ncbi:Endonuclease/exonuclease/phosphatase family protein [Roseibacterium elongatum DSM 19469]|uniref:Endonuclease/exonuclease/phosphatase family protein n=1 Tax=Roseicyclus elongatus DSM 19469 TaxID=1294273 RepID=W8RY41_9RHOB|nr:endonuclease/exonuclease/phosphatase family protein [Roseibacterium elongatum]AHM02767.1 Endonuclease/exonuclease/phosphatase family protein [Roseibacterium elongatum DSM 19469]
MRIATYNVEWFHALFDDDGRLLNDAAWSARHDVTREDQIAALAHVFRSLDADAILVVEAPDTSRHRDGTVALESFAAHAGLRARKALIGFANTTQQELMLLYDPDIIGARHDPQRATSGKGGANGAPRFDGAFRIDLDIDATQDVVTFSKPPLEAALETPLGPLRLIGVHVKSKAPHGANTPDEVMRIAIANRRKQLAQCIWLRRRVETHLAAGEDVIVLGDLNDGPGLDEYEKLFGRSGVEILMGLDAPRDLRLYDPHADRALQSRLAAQSSTARFFIEEEDRYLSALLDYIMVSPGLRAHAGSWRIWHPFEDPGCWRDARLRDALLTASDHFPVTLDLDATPS